MTEGDDDQRLMHERLRRMAGGPRFYILDGHELVRADLLSWARWFEDVDNRVVAQECIGDYAVSTICLGFDHNFFERGPPQLFETAVFLEGQSTDHQRYATWDQAMLGHQEICERLREFG
jgi:hypothetical protein